MTTKTMNERLSVLTMGQLAGIYNLTVAPEKKIKKFADRDTAVRRTHDALQAAKSDFFENGDGFVVQAASAPRAPAPAQPDEDDSDLRVITVLSEANPKKFKTGSHARFALYRTGMTVGTYVAAVIKSGRTRRVAIRDIQWDVDHGYILVS